MNDMSKPLPAEAQIVRDYLDASMKPDPEKAATYVADRVKITFTGGREFDHPSGPTAFNAHRCPFHRRQTGPLVPIPLRQNPQSFRRLTNELLKLLKMLLLPGRRLRTVLDVINDTADQVGRRHLIEGGATE